MDHAQTVSAGTPVPYKKATLVRMGSSCGIAANCIGWAIFLAMCTGFGAASYLSPLPVVLGLVGMALTVIGAVTKPHADVDTHVLASIFVNLMAIVGGLLEMSVLMKWTLFAR